MQTVVTQKKRQATAALNGRITLAHYLQSVPFSERKRKHTNLPELYHAAGKGAPVTVEPDSGKAFCADCGAPVTDTELVNWALHNCTEQ